MKIKKLNNTLKENYIEDESKFYEDEYERIDHNGSDEERLIAAVSYMYGVDMDTAKSYIPDLGTTQRNKAIAYYDLRNLPAQVRLAKIREMYPPQKLGEASQAEDDNLSEASYGGAYDIANDQYFTVEDIYDAAEEVLEHIKETFYKEYMIGGSWLEDGKWIVNIQTADGMEEFEESVQIDMRKIRTPLDLKAKYAFELAAKLIKAIKDSEYEELIPEGSTYAIKLSNGKYAVYIKDNYVGEYPRTIAEIKLKAFGDNVLIKEDLEHTDLRPGDVVYVKVAKKPGRVIKLISPDVVEVEIDDSINPVRIDRYYTDEVELIDSFENDMDAWEEVASKQVYDSDGFLTDYTWYTDGGTHIFIFGDKDVYTPENSYTDWEADDEESAKEWFDNYRGFEDDGLNEDVEGTVEYFVGDAESGYIYKGLANAEKARNHLIDLGLENIEIYPLEDELNESIVYRAEYYEPKIDKWISIGEKTSEEEANKLLDTPIVGNPKMRVQKYEKSGTRKVKYKELNEDTVKQDGKWVNKGKEGTHGKFKTKKAADAQRKAMFANGYKEGLCEGAISGTHRDFTYEQLADWEKELYSELNKNDIYPEDGTFYKSPGRLVDLELMLYIDGDWKHDHQFAEDIVEEFCEKHNMHIVKHSQQTIGHSDSDWYKAEHKWFIEMDEDGKTGETVATFRKMFAPINESDIKE